MSAFQSSDAARSSNLELNNGAKGSAHMIESIMYVGIGLLFGCLSAIAIMPLVHNRAIRLTIRRLEERLPQSMAEIQADKDLLRAEFAMLARRFEIIVGQLKNKITNQLVELGRKSDVINRLNAEGNQLKAEVTNPRREVGGAQNATQREMRTAKGHRRRSGNKHRNSSETEPRCPSFIDMMTAACARDVQKNEKRLRSRQWQTLESRCADIM